jgi:hypothetical protein
LADDAITVELLAKVDNLTSGLTEAVNAMRAAVDAIKGDVHGMSETAKESKDSLEEILHIEQFRMFAEAVKVMTETVKEAFESTVGAAEEFGLSTTKFASMMGTDQEHAAGLAAALQNVGSSTETYETIALRLEKSLRSSGGASKELKDQFKDSNGEFLTGVDLMDRLKSVTDGYSEGAARTSVEQALLGRQTKAYYDISRMTADDAERQTRIYKEMGVSFADLKENSVKLEEAEGDLRTAWKAEQIVIGQELMPIAKEAITWMGHDGKDLMKSLTDGVKFLIATFDMMKVMVVDVVVSVTGSLALVWDSIKMGGNLLADLANSDFAAMKRDWKAGTAEMANDAKGMATAISSEWDSVSEHVKALFPDKAAVANPFDIEGATGTRVGKGAPSHLTSGQDKGKKGKEDKGELEEIKSDEKIALAHEAIEQSKNQHLLAMGQESDAAFIAQAKASEDEQYLIQLDAFHREMEIEGRTELEKKKTLNAIALLEEEHAGKLLKIKQQAETQDAAVAKDQLTNAISADDERLKSGMAELQSELGAGRITAAEKAEQEMQLTATIRGEQIKRLNDAMALVSQDSKAYQQMLAERMRLEKQFTAEHKTESDQRTAALKAEAQQGIAPIASGFRTAVADMMSGTKTFQQSMTDMAKNIAAGFIQMCEQMAEKWLVTQLTNAAVQAASGTAQISTNAGVAASAGAASQAGIPIVGPALAVAAGAAMLGLVLGYEGLAHAEGGMTVDRDQLIFAHKNEMVLPAHLSRGVQQMIGSGGAAGGGDVNLHYAPQVSSQDKDLHTLLREQPGAMRAWLTQMQRDGAFSRGL